MGCAAAIAVPMGMSILAIVTALIAFVAAAVAPKSANEMSILFPPF